MCHSKFNINCSNDFPTQPLKELHILNHDHCIYHLLIKHFKAVPMMLKLTLVKHGTQSCTVTSSVYPKCNVCMQKTET
jgi:hypothetical protein